MQSFFLGGGGGSAQIKQDVLAMMVQYLRSEKLFMSAVVIQDEANMKTTEQQVCVCVYLLNCT